MLKRWTKLFRHCAARLGELLELFAEGGELVLDFAEFLTEAGYFFFQCCQTIGC